MNNTKNFEDFLDRMQGLLDNAKKQGHIIVRVEDLENTFPELKEGEDEKIRKRLYSLINDVKADLLHQYLLKKEEVLAWLEKQGKLVEYYEDKLDRCACENFDKGYKAALEKQGEQKAVNKVEPKFKDGDVLYSKMHNFIWIYKTDHSCYASYNNNYPDNGLMTNAVMYIPADATPAPKEWRELFFSKIKDAGYEWDAEKLELKKILAQNQKPAEWSEEDECIVTELIGIFESAVDGGYVDIPYRLIKDYIRVLKSCLPQNTWKPSEEQIQALEYQVHSTCKGSWQYKASKELLEQLKKL